MYFKNKTTYRKYSSAEKSACSAILHFATLKEANVYNAEYITRLTY